MIVDESVYKTDRATYSPKDFLLWLAHGDLVITPKFQRRPVWRTPARSSFIDTLLRGMTVPPLYMRWAQDKDTNKKVREVVDGQQRVRAVLDYVSEGYRLSKNLKAPWAGKAFGQLTVEQQDQIKYYSFPTETFKGISDAQILEVFCRLNMYGVPLNRQELRNGKFFGLFKQAAYGLALTYLEYWRKQKIFSERSIARMLEVELTSELLIAGREGMQDKKKSIDDYYEKWEDDYPDQKRDESRFNETMGVLSDVFPRGELAASEFGRAPLFYSLFCVVHHHMFGMPKVQRPTPKKKLSKDERNSLKDAVNKLSDIVAQYRDPLTRDEIPAKYINFVTACLRQTDNIQPRKMRFDALFGEAF